MHGLEFLRRKKAKVKHLDIRCFIKNLSLLQYNVGFIEIVDNSDSSGHFLVIHELSETMGFEERTLPQAP